MTEFKITPEDVGRVAVDTHQHEHTCVYVSEYTAAFEHFGNVRTYRVEDGENVENGNYPLTHWKPRTLVAPKRWWNVYRDGDGEYSVFDHDTFAEAIDVPPHSEPIARIYAEHWHNHEEGTFHTPEDFENE